MPTFLIYGATGYTGELIAREAVRRGMQPILAGRRREPVELLAKQLNCPASVFSLDNVDDLARQLHDVRAVLHCAGPFSTTAEPMMEACLKAGVNYLDITGEIPVIEAAASRGERAKQAGVALIPAVGFDVVPSDCLAARLARELPGATQLILAFAGLGGGFSRGTLKTIIENMPSQGRVRINGRIERVPVAWKTMDIPFRERTMAAMTVPWGDVASAYYTTGIGNIEVYMALPSAQISQARWLGLASPLLTFTPLRRSLQWLVEQTVSGPNDEQRASSRALFWGRVTDGGKGVVEGSLTAPGGYTLTAAAALGAVERVLTGDVGPGFWTPSQAFGEGFILSIPGTEIHVSRK